MAESVDALVSNTSGAIRAGSIPAPGTRQKCKCLIFKHLHFSFSFLHHGCTTKKGWDFVYANITSLFAIQI